MAGGLKSEKLPVSAIILAGGKGERVGGNKLFLSLDGAFLVEPLIEKLSFIFDEVLLCVGHGESETALDAFFPILRFCSVKLVEDRVSMRGPIEGLCVSLEAMGNEWGFLMGCDMPSPQEEVINYMWSRTVLNEDCKISAARFDGHIMPLHAFYHKDCSYHINSLIKSSGTFKKELRLKSFYCCTNTNFIEENELSQIPGWRKSFMGYNTNKELKSILEGRDYFFP